MENASKSTSKDKLVTKCINQQIRKYSMDDVRLVLKYRPKNAKEFYTLPHGIEFKAILGLNLNLRLPLNTWGE
jgi:hypothetical protein